MAPLLGGGSDGENWGARALSFDGAQGSWPPGVAVVGGWEWGGSLQPCGQCARGCPLNLSPC